MPGTLNYIEGSAQLNGQPVGQTSAGSTTLKTGQILATTDGHAEFLLTPGVFFRLAQNSSAKMVSPNLADTAVQIDHGRAAVEVDQLFKENNIHILMNNVPVQLIKTGFYEFDADRGTVMVFNGEVAVPKGNGHWTVVKAGKALNIAEGTNLKPASFDVDQAKQSGLYRWSSLRSDYLAEANNQLASQYGAGYAPGWYWDPWMFDYTFLGPSPFMSPFGWGFYPLGWGGMGWGGGWGGMGWGGGWYGPGYYGGGYYGGGGLQYGHGTRMGGLGAAPHGGAAGGFRGGAFRSGGELGGFHGGGGGFGGFHGGGGRGR
ncbi:MAG: hypothetical protein ACLGXA_23805 [Acidobacteriota bacterium]